MPIVPLTPAAVGLEPSAFAPLSKCRSSTSPPAPAELPPGEALSPFQKYSRLGADGNLHIRLPRLGSAANGLSRGGGLTRAGRPTSLRNDVAERILMALRVGMFRKPSCHWTGVEYPQFISWISRDEPRFAAFRQLVLEAEARCEMALLMKVRESTDPAHALALLSIRFRSRWGRNGPVVAGSTSMRDPDDADAPRTLALPEAMAAKLAALPTADRLALLKLAKALRGTPETPAVRPGMPPKIETDGLQDPTDAQVAQAGEIPPTVILEHPPQDSI